MKSKDSWDKKIAKDFKTLKHNESSTKEEKVKLIEKTIVTLLLLEINNTILLSAMLPTTNKRSSYEW